jgi:hypothetical protein
VIRNGPTILNLNNIIQNNILNWIVHVERLEPELIPMQLMGYIPRGTRSVRGLKLRRKARPVLYRNG